MRSQARTHVPGEVGIWIFILGDMMLYAALFGSFMIDRRADVAVYNESAATLHAGMASTRAAAHQLGLRGMGCPRCERIAAERAAAVRRCVRRWLCDQ
jgi:hypothetical protein